MPCMMVTRVGMLRCTAGGEKGDQGLPLTLPAGLP